MGPETALTELQVGL